MTVSWTDSSQIRITRLKLGLCHKVWFWSSPFHSSACLSWRLFPPLFDPCYPDIPVFSLLLAVFQDLVSQALDRIIVFHASCSIFCFLWYDRSGLLIYVPDSNRSVPWNALLLPSTRYFHCRHHRISFLFCQDHYHQCSDQTSSTGDFVFPLTIGLIHGCAMLTMRLSTLWVLFWYMYCCCSYSFIDCQQKSALFRCRCITVLHEIFEVSDISSDECQLFTNRCSDLLSAALFCFCKCKIIFSCYPAVHARSGKSICFAEVYDNHFQFFPCFIQQGKILWIDRLVLVTTS